MKEESCSCWTETLMFIASGPFWNSNRNVRPIPLKLTKEGSLLLHLPKSSYVYFRPPSLSLDEKGLGPGVRCSTQGAHHKQSVGLPGAPVNSITGPVRSGVGVGVQGSQAAPCFSPPRLPPGGFLYIHMTLFFSELTMICN